MRRSVVTLRRSPSWYWGSDSIGSRASFASSASFLVLELLITKRLSHDHWWYWPLVIATAMLAIWSIASALWLIRDRRRAGRASAPK